MAIGLGLGMATYTFSTAKDIGAGLNVATRQGSTLCGKQIV